MTPLRLDQLPAAVRARVEAEHDISPRRRTTRTAAKAGGYPVRCSCGEVYDHYGIAVERCADSHGGGRIEVVFR